MNIATIMSQMLILFLLLAAGYIANKTKIMNIEANKLLSKLVVNIVMPCTILSSVMGGDTGISGSTAAYFMLLSFGAYLVFFMLALPLPRLLGAPKSDGGMLSFMVVFGNVGFMGIPVVQALFGNGAVFYVTMFNIAFSVLCFSFGIIMVSGKGEKFNPMLLVNPTMVVSVLAIIIFYTKLPIPLVISDAFSIMGKMTTPAAMLILGSTLASIPLWEVFTEWRVYVITFVKLIVVPIVIWLLARLVVHDNEVLGILVTLAAMPTATNATMLSLQYGGNEKLAAQGIFITTLISVITIPVLLSIIF